MNAIEMNENIRRGRFFKNNGKVLKMINAIRYEYSSLEDLKYVIGDIKINEYADSVNYLTEIGYIKLRNRHTKHESSLEDDMLEDLEAKLTAKGIKFLAGKLDDDCVER